MDRYSYNSRRIDQYSGRVGDMAAGATACALERASGTALDCVFIKYSLHTYWAACVSGLVITATNTSEMLGVRTSPRAVNLVRSALSNRRTLRPSAWPSCIGFKARAAASLSGFTVTSR